MKIAVLSDIHDHIWNLKKALGIIKEEKFQAIIFCGDFCMPSIAAYLVETKLPVYAIFGNNDEDQWGIVERVGVGRMKVFPLSAQFGEVAFEGKKVAIIHYPKLAYALAKIGDYDAVFFGHDHQSHQETVGKTLLANPGAICGIQKGKPGVASFGKYDTKSHTFAITTFS